MIVKWIPELSRGYYAIASLNSKANITRNISNSLQFNTKSECQAWINAWELRFGVTKNRFIPVEHGFEGEN